MDLASIKTMNIVGTILFIIPAVILAIILAFGASLFFFFDPTGGGAVCLTIAVLIIVTILVLAFLIYRNTVTELELGNYDKAKRWTLYAAIAAIITGFSSVIGWITFALFLISYVSFDDALRPKWPYPYMPQYHPGYLPQQPYPPAYQYPPQPYPAYDYSQGGQPRYCVISCSGCGNTVTTLAGTESRCPYCGKVNQA